jgi:hypothetical protein
VLPERLLPRFDALVLGHRDKSRYLEPRDRPKVFRPAAVVEPVVLACGRVAGTWSYDRPGEARLFRPVPAAARRRLRGEAARVLRLLDA